MDNQILRLAKDYDPTSLHLLQSISGVGEILSLTMLYEIHDIGRFPSRQDFCSYARLVKGQKSSNGKNYGTSGARIGNAHLRWAFSEAALLYLRGNKQAEKYYNRLISRHGKGKALTIVAKRLGIAVYYMLKRRQPSLNTACSKTPERVSKMTLAEQLFFSCQEGVLPVDFGGHI